jgi:hypothetical protein
MESAVQQIALELGETVINQTPVDTGFLKGSWFVSINNPSVSFTGVEDKSGSGSKSRIASGVQAYELGDTIYILNNTPYGPFVEYGTVKMAPRSFVRSTVGLAPQVVNATVRRFNIV